MLTKGTIYYQIWTPKTLAGVAVARVTGTHQYVFWHNNEPRYSGTPSAPYRSTGIYLISIPLTGDNFFTGSTYGLNVIGSASGYRNTRSFGTFGVGQATLANYSGFQNNSYYADINLCKHDISGQDRYTIQWFKNGVHQTGISSPSFIVYDYTGGNKVPSTNMSLLTGQYFSLAKYDVTGSQRIGTGERYVIECYATIDGLQQKWREPIYRDYNL